MYEIWANVGLLMLAAIVGGIVWFVFWVFGKAFFEDFLGGMAKKVKKKKEDEDDYYIY